jgi:UDP-glucose:(heptosyl)LPS alpha-1,3-glucosyltransferase
MERWAYRATRTPRFAVVSDALSDEVTESFGRSREEVEVIGNGVDTTVFRPNARVSREVRHALGITSDRLIAVFSGGDWERKGLGIAIDAVAHAPQWDLLVVGQGDTATYSGHAKTVGARVHFVGHTAEPQRFYCAGDAFVCPTTYEGFSLAVLEASATGLPLLVTESSGANRLVRPGVNGWFVERTSQSVALYLNRLTDPDTRTAFARHARESARAFAWPEIVDAYERALLQSSS